MDNPDAARLLAELGQAEQVLTPHEVFHYSNLAFALLGQVIERLERRPWEDVVRQRVLHPLGMTRTGLTPAADRARGYLVHPFSGVATEEPVADLKATAPWRALVDGRRPSRYAVFVADPTRPSRTGHRPDVPAAGHPDPDAWTLGYGLSRDGPTGDRI
jgi:CubicO group peptidase (beta-lactamase class C family)